MHPFKTFSNAVFKKVIGQEMGEATKPSLTTPDERSATSNSRESQSTENAKQSSRNTAQAPAGNTRNILSSDVEIKGIVKFNHDLIVDGKIEGDIQSSGNLTVGENARIKAEIKTGTVIVYGKVHGNIVAIDRVELKSSAEVVGDIKAKILTIESGAIFVGKSTVGTPSQGSGSPDLKAGQPVSSQQTPASSH